MIHDMVPDDARELDLEVQLTQALESLIHARQEAWFLRRQIARLEHQLEMLHRAMMQP